MPWICLGLVVVALLYAGDAKFQRDYWKNRCEAVELGCQDRCLLYIVNRDKPAGQMYPGPAVLHLAVTDQSIAS